MGLACTLWWTHPRVAPHPNVHSLVYIVPSPECVETCDWLSHQQNMAHLMSPLCDYSCYVRLHLASRLTLGTLLAGWLKSSGHAGEAHSDNELQVLSRS